MPAAAGGILSYPLTADDDSSSFREFRERELGKITVSDPKEATAEADGKNDYLRRKEEAANRRKAEKRRQQREARISELEKLLPELEKEMYDLNTDYMRSAELQKQIEEFENELLTLYEEEEEA